MSQFSQEQGIATGGHAHSLSASKIQDYFLFIRRLVKEPFDHLFNSMHAQPISTYPPLEAERSKVSAIQKENGT